MKSTPQRSGLWFWLFIVLLFSTAATVTAVEAAFHFSGTPIDGPFQLYDALRRIAAGYRVGVDFQFFHGVGIPYLYYNFFRLFGAGLQGAELARNLLSPVLYTLVALVFFRAFTGNWTRALYGAGTVLVLTFTPQLSGAFFALLLAVNGMLGVRATMPLLVPVALFLARTRAQRIVGTGIVLGLALFYSSEQGLAVTMAFTVVSAVGILRGRGRMRLAADAPAGSDRVERLINSISTLCIAIATLCLTLTSVGGWSGMLGALRYNFAIVPADQYWFFGAPPNVFLSSWSAMPTMILHNWAIKYGILFGFTWSAVYLVRLWKAADVNSERRVFSLAILAVYGFISLASLLGVFTGAYVQPCWRTIVFLTVLEWLGLSERLAKRGGTTGRETMLGVPRAAALVTCVLAFVSVITLPITLTSFIVTLPHVLSDHIFGHQRFQVGGVWPEALATGDSIMRARRRPDGSPPSLWSTYTGWIEARNGEFNPSFDYMIHALGPANRERYVRTFAQSKPDLVQTVLPTFTQYEPWLENTNWEFYDELLKWYEVATTTRWSIYWTRRATPAPAPVAIAEAHVQPDMKGILLPPITAQTTSPDGLILLEVEIEYTISNPLRRLPILGNTPRFLVGIDSAVTHVPVSLDPFVTKTRFPLVMRAGQRPVLSFATMGLVPGALFTPHAIHLYRRDIAAPNTFWLDNLGKRAAADTWSEVR